MFNIGWVSRLQHINNNKHGYNVDPQQSKSLMNWHLFFLMTGYYQINNGDFSAAFSQKKEKSQYVFVG